MNLFTQIAPYILLAAVLAGAILIATHNERHDDHRKSQHD
jgi:hypothetical protein